MVQVSALFVVALFKVDSCQVQLFVTTVVLFLVVVVLVLVSWPCPSTTAQLLYVITGVSVEATGSST